jgi:hypothetical protein
MHDRAVDPIRGALLPCQCATCERGRHRDERRGAGRAYRLVQAAIQHGRLAKRDGTIACADCGRPATEYDHRDYGQPLLVAPVCHRCNVRRPPAKWREPEITA